MTARLNPYVSFAGTAREAMEFYRDVFGGALTMTTFKEYGIDDAPVADQIMHASLETDRGFTLMGADTPPGRERNPGDNISIILNGDESELRGYFEKLAAGGTVVTPLEAQMWGDEYGACVDRFGVTWMVNISPAQT